MKLTCLNWLLASLIVLVTSEDVRLDNLEPSEAQQLIESKDQSLKYAPKVDSNVPAVRYLGNEPHDVLEDIYLANQYHGQDGVGGYLYGYAVPDIAKTEKKQAGGDLRGAYNYVNGQGQEIKVEYWDDGTGFHQVDNVPKILPKQIDDTDEVKAAKEEHDRLWKEQAERNSKPVPSPYINNAYKPEIAAQIGAQSHAGSQYQQQPQGQYDQHQQYKQAQGQNQLQGQYSQPQGQYNQPQGQNQAQGQYSQAQGQQNKPQGQYNQPQGQNQAQGQYNQAQGQQNQPQGQYNQPQGHNQAQGQYNQAQGQQNKPQGQYNQPQGQYNQPQGQSLTQGQYNQPQGQHNQPQGQHNQPSQLGQYTQAQGQSGQQGFKPNVNVGQPSGNLNQIDYSGQYSSNRDSYSSGQGQGGDEGNDEGKWDEGKYDEGKWEEKNEENAEENGPPRGFFYNFDYPVGIIVSKDGNQVQKRESIEDVYAKGKDLLEKQLKGEVKPAGTGYPNYFVTQ